MQIIALRSFVSELLLALPSAVGIVFLPLQSLSARDFG